MTVFHIIGYWYLALTLAAVAALLTWGLVEFTGRTLWRKMRRLRDIWVLNWWIEALKKAGVTVPTKGNIEKLKRLVERTESEE